ncbi:MAG: hypothetical protein ACODAD_15070, partial [Planctomycetota bacterium]
LYWLMVKLLPGYGYFRYPPKLWTVTSLAISLLAGLGLEESLASDRTRLCRVLKAVGIGSAVAGVVFAVLSIWWCEWFAAAGPDELFGPLDARGAWHGCLLACSQSVALCFLFWWLLRNRARSTVWLGYAILLVTAVEMAWANGSHVVTAPAEAMRCASVLTRLGLDSHGVSCGNGTRVLGVSDQRERPISVPRSHSVRGPAALGMTHQQLRRFNVSPRRSGHWLRSQSACSEKRTHFAARSASATLRDLPKSAVRCCLEGADVPSVNRRDSGMSSLRARHHVARQSHLNAISSSWSSPIQRI